MLIASEDLPKWGSHRVNMSARDAGAFVVWGARVIEDGFDMPYDRNEMSDSPLEFRIQLQHWINAPCPISAHPGRVGPSPFELAKIAAARMMPNETKIVVTHNDLGEGKTYQMIARLAGGYVYLTACILPSGTTAWDGELNLA